MLTKVDAPPFDPRLFDLVEKLIERLGESVDVTAMTVSEGVSGTVVNRAAYADALASAPTKQPIPVSTAADPIMYFIEATIFGRGAGLQHQRCVCIRLRDVCTWKLGKMEVGSLPPSEER